MHGSVMLTEEYWTERYKHHETGWDIGYVSTPLKEYFDQLKDKSKKILIPGAGNAYEAEYLWKQGFKNVWVVDLSEAPLNYLKARVPDFPNDQLIHANFFDLKGKYDLIIEQTFFCALDPSLRAQYVYHMKELLAKGGKLVGLLFNVPLNADRPPFGGSRDEYKMLFSDSFNIYTMETAYNSIGPREGRELFVMLKN